MIYIVRKSIRRTGRVILEKTFATTDFRSPEQAYRAAFNIALGEDAVKSDNELVQLLTVCEICNF